MKADLHIHSKYSFDSTDTVDQIINSALKKGLSLIAIADHNQYRGALELSQDSRIKSISAIEIDCYFNDEIIHLLGYGIDLSHPYYEELYNHYKNELARIGETRLQLIEAHHQIKIDRTQLLALTHGDYSFTNVEITQILLDTFKDHPDLEPYIHGHRKNNPVANYYWDNLSLGKWGYVAMDLPNYQEVIDMFHQTHGICIVAHPIVGAKKDLVLIQQLIESGIDGFEAYSSYHDLETIQFYQELCESKGLLWTCGSDYHGQTKPNIELGETKYEKNDDLWLLPLIEKINHTT